jgi:hypothetical protein
MKAAPMPALPAEIAAAAARGWRLFPVEAHGKKPLVKQWEKFATNDLAKLTAWAAQFPKRNWGVATGTGSGLAIVDIDGPEGRASLADLERQGLSLPATLTVTTGRADGGEHRYYKMPHGVDIRNDQSGKIGAHIDVRGTGGFVVCPPSIHASGKKYRFVDSDAPIADFPTWADERLTSRPSVTTAQTSPQAVGKGERTKRLVSLAGTLQKRMADAATIEAALLAENAAKCDPPLPRAKVISIARDIPNRYPVSQSVAPVTPALPLMTREEASRITGELIDQCRVWIRRFVVLGDPEIMIIACWLLHTWAFDAAVVTPYIHVHSAEKGSGKTILLLVLKAVAHEPMFSSSISAAALARVVVKFRPTLFLDELDAQMCGDKERAQDIRGVLNSGYEIDGSYLRCVGKDFEVVAYPTFCPKALAGIGELWDTVQDRAIGIEMRRRLPSDKIEPFRKRRIEEDAALIKSALKGWADRGAAKHLEQIEVSDIPGLNDRQMDISEPLVQIAQLAGREWNIKLVDALQSIFKVSTAEDRSIGTMILKDIRSIFEGRNADRVFSRDLAVALCALEGHPWQDWARGQGLTPNRLAKLLRPFHIFSQTIDSGKESLKGYKAEQFSDAFGRYIPIQNDEESEPAPVLDKTPFSKRRTVGRPTFQKVNAPRAGIDVRRSDVSKAGEHGLENLAEVRV